MVIKLPKNVYDYVMYRLDDPAQLPIRYLTINDISNLTGKSKKSLHNQFNVLNGVVWDLYGIERFKKEEEDNKMENIYEEIVDLRNRLSNDTGETVVYEEDHLLLDVVLDMIEENKGVKNE